MTPYNLAVVFNPCFIRPKEFGMDQLLESGHAVNALKIIIENSEKIFPQFEKVYIDSVESGKKSVESKTNK
jgi:hypothetical protein